MSVENIVRFSQIAIYCREAVDKQNLLGDHSIMDPPDPMPNSVVKRNSADGSVGSPHVRVGHRQALILHLLEIQASHHKALSFLRVLC